MPDSLEDRLFPGQYEVSGGEVVFLDTPTGVVRFQIHDPHGDVFNLVSWMPGLPDVFTAAGIYLKREPLWSRTKVVFSAIEAPLQWGGLSGMHTIVAVYDQDYLRPSWRFNIDRTFDEG